jgi:broad specificity phosphatase PhoE
MTTAYLARHGETIWNVEERFQSFTDNPLNANGTLHAVNLANVLKDIQLDAIFCSPLKRARYTASEIARHHPKTPIINEPTLTELNGGIFEGLTEREQKQKYPEEYSCRKTDRYNFRIPGGESYSEVFQRIKPFIGELLKKFMNKNVLVVAHQGVNRSIINHLTSIEEKEIPRIKIPFNEVIKIETIDQRVERIKI